MEPNRRFVIRNNKEGAGTQWNLLATGGSLMSGTVLGQGDTQGQGGLWSGRRGEVKEAG